MRSCARPARFSRPGPATGKPGGGVHGGKPGGVRGRAGHQGAAPGRGRGLGVGYYAARSRPPSAGWTAGPVSWLRRMRVDDLTPAALAALACRGPAWWHRGVRAAFLVCAHVRRDRCCGWFGVPVALASRPGTRAGSGRRARRRPPFRRQPRHPAARAVLRPGGPARGPRRDRCLPARRDHRARLPGRAGQYIEAQEAGCAAAALG